MSVDWSQAWVARRDAVAAEGGGCGVVPPEAGELGQLVRAAHLWGREGVGVVLSTCMRARARSAGTDSPLSRAIKCNQVQSSAIKCNHLLPRAHWIQTAEPMLDDNKGGLEQVRLGVFGRGEDRIRKGEPCVDLGTQYVVIVRDGVTERRVLSTGGASQIKAGRPKLGRGVSFRNQRSSRAIKCNHAPVDWPPKSCPRRVRATWPHRLLYSEGNGCGSVARTCGKGGRAPW